MDELRSILSEFSFEPWNRFTAALMLAMVVARSTERALGEVRCARGEYIHRTGLGDASTSTAGVAARLTQFPTLARICVTWGVTVWGERAPQSGSPALRSRKMYRSRSV